MRLTKDIRDTILRAIVDDVPFTDYREAMEKLVLDHVVAALPEDIRKLWNNKKLKPYVRNGEHMHRIGGGNFEFFVYPGPAMSPDAFSQIEGALIELGAKADAQHEKRMALSRHLEAHLKSCRTAESFLKRFPEFEKYVPKDDTQSFPLATNIVAELMQAGWKAT